MPDDRTSNHFKLGPHTVQVLAETGSSCFAEGTFQPGIPGPPVHAHDWDEGFYVISGELAVTVNDATSVLRSGDFALAPAGSFHTFAVHGSSPASVFATFSSEQGIAYLREMADIIGEGPPDPDLMRTLYERYGVTIVGA